MATKRSYGSGSLSVRTDAAGCEAWYGRWYTDDGRRVQRKIGPKRKPGTREGLTRPRAEAELRRLIESDVGNLPTSTVTVTDAADRMLDELRRRGRKPTTLATYRSILDTHLTPRVGKVNLSRATERDVERLIDGMQEDEKQPKTIRNAVTLLYQVFEYGRRKKWCRENPCADVERPESDPDRDIRFLDRDELEALLRAVDTDAEPYGPTDVAMFLTAAMTGLRQGELLALRWRDVDWSAAKVRVRRNYVRGHWGAPKSKRGTRSVPLSDRVAAALEHHFQRSAYQGDDDLVFGHPHTGHVLDHSALVRRFKAALKAAEVRPVRFHDLRHTFGTRMAAAGVPMRTLMEWMGHGSMTTTLIYADYAPGDRDRELVEAAFSAPVSQSGSQTEENPAKLSAPDSAETAL